jgi:ABC-type glutathione transport system ATPase component
LAVTSPKFCSSVTSLLQVSELSVNYASVGPEATPALRHISFEVAPGEIVGILGESGCGKSSLALSILGILPQGATAQGSIRYRGEELLGRDEGRLRKIRGARISLIHQEPGLALSPVMRVGDQIAEVLRAHGDDSRQARREQVGAILRSVHLADTHRIARAYPHELSGGELHRVAIAQALVCRPDLVIADEPNRALDATLQLELLDLLSELNREFGTALLFITHNPMLLAGFADRVLVIRSGEIVEHGPVAEVFRRPANAYTRLLLQFVPQPISAATETLSRAPRELIPR